MSAEVKQNNKEAIASERGQKMAYKKPEIVAKSAAKQSFVAGCPMISKKGAPTRPDLCKEKWG